MEAEYTPPRSWRTWLIGRPLATADAPHQTIGKIVGLAVFASDALSSTAYATQEILVVLAFAGTSALGYAFPISLAIVVLLAIVTLSYEQTIHAYPGGGGAYIVARDNLGELPAQTAGAALLTDYVLTVAVSISSGVAQIASAYPALYAHRVWIAVGLVLFVMLINLRGVKESGTIFALPTYFFLVMMFLTVGVGLGPIPDRLAGHRRRSADRWNGCTLPKAITLVPDPARLCQRHDGADRRGGHLQRHHRLQGAAQPQRRHHPDLDVCHPGHAVPGHHASWPGRSAPFPLKRKRSSRSWPARSIAGRGVLYLATIAATTVILIMAANTSFADFPRLSALHAGGWLLAAPAHLPGQPAGLLAGHRGPGG